VLTGAQIRAARALLRWSNFDLAEKAKVSFAAIQRAQSVDGTPNMLLSTADSLKGALEKAGVVFIDRGDYGGGGPGVRLRK
jgi:ribosome-binding protein aMBF1 (putative translation factor)